jgi:hypothetical protein
MAGASAAIALIMFIFGLIICIVLFLIDTQSLLATGSFITFLSISAIILIWKVISGGVKNG